MKESNFFKLWITLKEDLKINDITLFMSVLEALKDFNLKSKASFVFFSNLDNLTEIHLVVKTFDSTLLNIIDEVENLMKCIAAQLQIFSESLELVDLTSISLEEASSLVFNFNWSASDIYELDEEASEVFDEIINEEILSIKPKKYKRILN